MTRKQQPEKIRFQQLRTRAGHCHTSLGSTCNVLYAPQRAPASPSSGGKAAPYAWQRLRAAGGGPSRLLDRQGTTAAAGGGASLPARGRRRRRRRSAPVSGRRQQHGSPAMPRRRLHAGGGSP